MGNNRSQWDSPPWRLMPMAIQLQSLPRKSRQRFSQQNLSVSGQPVYSFEQPINLRDGENYLYLGVWDANTGQFGTIQLSLDATHPKAGQNISEN